MNKAYMFRWHAMLLMRLIIISMGAALACSLLLPSLAGAATTANFIADGGFELGIVDMDIVRYPRYPHTGQEGISPPRRDSKNALSGDYSLLLPETPEGGYVLTVKTLPLLAGKQYELSFRIRTTGASANITAEIFAGRWRRIHQKITTQRSPRKRFTMHFRAAETPVINKGVVPHLLRIWISGKTDIWLDDISLVGPASATSLPEEQRIWLEPDKPTAVYHIDEQDATFHVRAHDCAGCMLDYEVLEPVHGETIFRSEVKVTADSANLFSVAIPLPTMKRGFFWVKAILRNDNGLVGREQKRGYVVINPAPASSPGRAAFGICLEEHGYRTQIPAMLKPDDIYQLAHEIGVGSARVFSLASPTMISKNGRDFDFHELDAALDLLKKYKIEPMIVLGINELSRIPKWMRGSRSNQESINLLNGLRVPLARKRFVKEKGGQFFYLDKYKIYLENIFSHLKGKVKYYELWNEPGHKFMEDDFVKIAKLTRSTQKAVDPDARLIGYSSTKSHGVGKGIDPAYMPSFVAGMLRKSGAGNIDILSYHSGHAFLFNDANPDYRNQETGYVSRLKKLLKREGKADLPIWDTERGIPWSSSHSERIDQMDGVKKWKYAKKSFVNALDVARQLPMVYSAALADGVDRLFWFYLDSSAGLITRTKKRWGFFDAQLEPMPQIPVYNAMTEILGESTFKIRIEGDHGARIYIYQNPDSVILLAYNWKNRADSFHITGIKREEIRVLDVMGNKITNWYVSGENNVVPINGWPRYIILPGKRIKDIKVVTGRHN